MIGILLSFMAFLTNVMRLSSVSALFGNLYLGCPNVVSMINTSAWQGLAASHVLEESTLKSPV